MTTYDKLYQRRPTWSTLLINAGKNGKSAQQDSMQSVNLFYRLRKSNAFLTEFNARHVRLPKAEGCRQSEPCRCYESNSFEFVYSISIFSTSLAASIFPNDLKKTIAISISAMLMPLSTSIISPIS